MAIKYRVIDIRTGRGRGIFPSYKSALKHADKIEPGGNYVMLIEEIMKRPYRYSKKQIGNAKNYWKTSR